MIEKSAIINNRIRTNLNGNLLSSTGGTSTTSNSNSNSTTTTTSSSSKNTAKNKKEIIKFNMLESIYDHLSSEFSKNLIDTEKEMDFDYLNTVHSALNIEMSSEMAIRDEEVEPDVESFRCLNNFE